MPIGWNTTKKICSFTHGKSYPWSKLGALSGIFLNPYAIFPFAWSSGKKENSSHRFPLKPTNPKMDVNQHVPFKFRLKPKNPIKPRIQRKVRRFKFQPMDAIVVSCFSAPLVSLALFASRLHDAGPFRAWVQGELLSQPLGLGRSLGAQI